MRLKDNGAKYRRLSCTSNPHTLTESQRTKEVLYVWPLITKSISSNITTIQYHCSHHLPKLAWSKQRFLCEPEDTHVMWKNPVGISVLMLSVCPCMYRNPHRHTTHTQTEHILQPFQRSLPETRVHYCSLTSASRRITTGFSPSVTFLCSVATE